MRNYEIKELLLYTIGEIKDLTEKVNSHSYGKLGNIFYQN